MASRRSAAAARADGPDLFLAWIGAAVAERQALERVAAGEDGQPRAVFSATPDLARVFALAGDGEEAILAAQPNTLAALASVAWTSARLWLSRDPAAKGWWLRLTADPYRREAAADGAADGAPRMVSSAHAADLLIPVLSIAVRCFPQRATALSLRRVTLAPDGRPKEVGRAALRRMPIEIADWPA